MIEPISPRILHLRTIVRQRFTRGADKVVPLARVAIADGADIEELILLAQSLPSWRSFEHQLLSRCREE